MLNFTSRTNFYICSIPTDMRNGREGLTTIVREYFHRNLLEDKSDKYKVEYIHAALSLEKKLVVMLYGEGSRSQTIPEEQIFEHSNIKYFTADRAKLYDIVVKSIEEKYGVKITRTACWFRIFYEAWLYSLTFIWLCLSENEAGVAR